MWILVQNAMAEDRGECLYRQGVAFRKMNEYNYSNKQQSPFITRCTLQHFFVFTYSVNVSQKLLSRHTPTRETGTVY